MDADDVSAERSTVSGDSELRGLVFAILDARIDEVTRAGMADDGDHGWDLGIEAASLKEIRSKIAANLAAAAPLSPLGEALGAAVEIPVGSLAEARAVHDERTADAPADEVERWTTVDRHFDPWHRGARPVPAAPADEVGPTWNDVEAAYDGGYEAGRLVRPAVMWTGGHPITSTVPPLARPVPAAPAEPGATEGDVTQNLGAQIKARRAASGMMLADVARRADLHLSYVSNLEHGRGNPTIRAVAALAAALGTTPSELLSPRPAPVSAAPTEETT